MFARALASCHSPQTRSQIAEPLMCPDVNAARWITICGEWYLELWSTIQPVLVARVCAARISFLRVLPYPDLKNYFVFRREFGRYLDVLRRLLNDVLGHTGERMIARLMRALSTSCS
jgi:hypothetical protein